MEGQTTIEPCAICGEPSVSEHIITPTQMGSRDGEKVVRREGRRAWLCYTHVLALVEPDTKAPEVDKRLTAAANRRFKRDQLQLGGNE